MGDHTFVEFLVTPPAHLIDLKVINCTVRRSVVEAKGYTITLEALADGGTIIGVASCDVGSDGLRRQSRVEETTYTTFASSVRSSNWDD